MVFFAGTVIKLWVIDQKVVLDPEDVVDADDNCIDANPITNPNNGDPWLDLDWHPRVSQPTPGLAKKKKRVFWEGIRAWIDVLKVIDNSGQTISEGRREWEKAITNQGTKESKKASSSSSSFFAYSQLRKLHLVCHPIDFRGRKSRAKMMTNPAWHAAFKKGLPIYFAEKWSLHWEIYNSSESQLICFLPQLQRPYSEIVSLQAEWKRRAKAAKRLPNDGGPNGLGLWCLTFGRV